MDTKNLNQEENTINKFWTHAKNLNTVTINGSLWKYSKKLKKLVIFPIYIQDNEFGYIRNGGKILHHTLNYDCKISKYEKAGNNGLKYCLSLAYYPFTKIKSDLKSINDTDNAEQQQDIVCFKTKITKEFYSSNANEIDYWYQKLSPHCLKTNFSNDYQFEEKIGQGSYSTVHKIRSKKTGKYFAAKTSSINSNNITFKMMLLNEAKIYRELNHPNIPKIYDVYMTQEMIIIVIDLITGGDLFDRLLAIEKYTETKAAQLIKNLLEVLKYINEKAIIHRDIKFGNILLTNIMDDTSIQLIDFGLACKLKDICKSKACGTPGLIAPEILKGQGANLKSDIFSAGIILYALLSGTVPFQDITLKKMLRRNCECSLRFPSKYWNDISHEAQELVKKMTHPNPDERISVDNALNNDWLKKHTAISKSISSTNHLLNLQTTALESIISHIPSFKTSTSNLHEKISENSQNKKHFTSSIYGIFGPKLDNTILIEVNNFNGENNNDNLTFNNDDDNASSDESIHISCDDSSINQLEIKLSNIHYITEVKKTPFQKINK